MRSSGPTVRTLADLVFHIRDVSAGRTELLTLRKAECEVALSTADFLRGIHALALALEGRGLEKGDRVALLGEGRPEWHQVDLACQLLGLVTVPIDPTSSAEQVGYILRNSGSRWIFHGGEGNRELLEGLQRTLPRSAILVALEESEGETIDLTLLFGEGAARQGDVPLEHFRGRVGANDLATLLYTSGTTGDPKGVMLSQRNLVSNVLACGKIFDLGPHDRAISFLPLSHGFQRTIDHLCFLQGVALCYVPKVEDVPEALRVFRPTLLVAVPWVYERAQRRTSELLAEEGWLRRKLFPWALRVGARYRRALRGGIVGPILSLERRLCEMLVFRWVRQRFGGQLRFALCGGPLSPETADLFSAVGLPIDQGYGLAESSPVLAATAPRQRREGSVGKALDDVELRLAEDGEILARGPGVMMGYWEDPEATAASVDDSGWLRTGDVGRIDQSGYLYVTDRKQDLLVTTEGHRIAPQPIEQQLVGDGILRAVVVGDRRPYLGALLVPDFERWTAELVAGDDAYDPEDPEDSEETREDETGENTGRTPTLDGEGVARHPEVVEHLARRVKEVNALLPPEEQIRRVAVLERDFEIELGELTPSRKLRRRVIVQRWAERIAEDLYGAE